MGKYSDDQQLDTLMRRHVRLDAAMWRAYRNWNEHGKPLDHPTERAWETALGKVRENEQMQRERRRAIALAHRAQGCTWREMPSDGRYLECEECGKVKYNPVHWGEEAI